MNEFSVHHHKVSPYHPAANGEVERFNRTLTKCIQTAIAAGENWHISLQNFLLSYRTTPHAITGLSPADAFFACVIRDKHPSIAKTPRAKTNLKKRDQNQKSISKQYTDTKRGARGHHYKCGDTVLIQNPASNRDKFTPRWLDKPYIITSVKGNAIFF